MSRLQKNLQFKKYNSFSKIGGQSLFSSINKQKKRLQERRTTEDYLVNFKNIELIIDRGVYRTGRDTELMIDVLSKAKGQSFLEIGCGCGAISVFLSKSFKNGIAVDINKLAVYNSIKNCKLNNINNIKVYRGNVFENVEDKFDIIICNPPYNKYESIDDIDKMFWDKNNSMKKEFFKNAHKYLKLGGKIYFGWADFADIDFEYPITLAKESYLKLLAVYSKPSSCSSFRFLVFEFVKS